MNKAKILSALNKDPLDFLRELSIKRKVEMKIAGKKFIFVRDFLSGGAGVICGEKTGRLKIKNKLWLFVD